MLPSFKKAESEPFRVTPANPLPATGQGTSPLGAAPTASPLRPGTAMSVIGADLLVSGNLISKGQIQIDGEVQGDIHASLVSVGEQAKVTGSIIGEEVVVRGHVLGSVRGRRVLLQTSSHVEGDVFHQTLAIEQGAYFEGKSRRTDDPTAGMIRSREGISAMPSTTPPPLTPPPVHEAPAVAQAAPAVTDLAEPDSLPV